MTLRLPILRLAAVVLTALAILLALVAGSATARPYVLTKGHIDALSPTIEDGELRLRLADDTLIHSPESHVIRDVDDVLLNLHDGAKQTIPALPPAYAFLGLQEGDEHWTVDLSGSNQGSVIWPGWDTQHESVQGEMDELAPNQRFRFRLVQAVRPSGAGVHLWDTSFAGPRIFASTTADAWNAASWPGVTGPNAWSTAYQHQHAAWSFTKPGLYQLTFAVEARKDGHPMTASADYVFRVGDLPDPAAANGGLPELTLGGLEDHYEVGETIALTTAQAPETGEDHFHWYTRCGDDQPWKTVSGALAASHSFAATADLDGCLIQARLFDHDHALIALTTPGTLHVHDHDPGAPATTLTIEGLEAHYHPGDVATLTAKQDPETGEDHWHWFVQCGDNPWTVVSGALGATLTLPLEQRHHGCLVQAKLYDHDHAVIAESAPVTLAVEDHGDHHEPTPDPIPGPLPGPQPQPLPLPLPGPAPSPAPPVTPTPKSVELRVTKRKNAIRSRSLRRSGRLAVRFRTDGPARVRTTVRISARDARRIGLRVKRGAKRITLGRATRQVKRGGTGTLKVRLKATHRRALAKVRGTLRLRVTTTARAHDRPTASRTIVVKVRR
ncbi:MAG: choice-of-anchor M domain-containing protein [Patulibacter sp.]|nr:choice-of-anchor M domain-containing protein [Patulibacter sp.]